MLTLLCSLNHHEEILEKLCAFAPLREKKTLNFLNQT